jgi:hypothetical protein
MEWKLKWEKTKVMRISRQATQVQMMDKKQLNSVKNFNRLGSVITNDARRTREIKSGIYMAKAAFSKKKPFFFYQQIGLKF